MAQQQKRGGATAKRMVWRITEAAPLGEFVDAATAPAAARERDSSGHGNWALSSFELLHGTEISEGPDTVPDELFDELFAPSPSAVKPAPPA